MKSAMIVAAAALLVPSLLVSVPAQAETAYQHWERGRGVDVSSKARPSSLLSDFGLIEEPPPPLRRGPYRNAPPPGYEDTYTPNE